MKKWPGCSFGRQDEDDMFRYLHCMLCLGCCSTSYLQAKYDHLLCPESHPCLDDLNMVTRNHMKCLMGFQSLDAVTCFSADHLILSGLWTKSITLPLDHGYDHTAHSINEPFTGKIMCTFMSTWTQKHTLMLLYELITDKHVWSALRYLTTRTHTHTRTHSTDESQHSAAVVVHTDA